MSRILLSILTIMLASVTQADEVVAARTIRSQTIITMADLAVVSGRTGEISTLESALGLEAKINLYKGQPIRMADLGRAATIDRNQLVTLSYRRGPLTILAEGRALGRGGVGDTVRALNAASRATVFGTVSADGSIQVATQD